MLQEVADRLNEERVRLGKSKAAFSRDLEITMEGWRQIERGNSNFKIGVLSRASDLGADVQYVVTGVRSLNPPNRAPDSI